MNRPEILNWLKESDAGRLEELWRRADGVRRENVGDAVHLRGLVEISNHCARQCGYCGLRAGNVELGRYRMSEEEILAAAGQAVRMGYGTVVLQGGEDYGITREWMAGVVRRIKERFGEVEQALRDDLGEGITGPRKRPLRVGETVGGYAHPTASGVPGEGKRGRGLAVTLSLGERSEEDLAAWREAGADRYLLRFETSDRELYERIHPNHGTKVSDRVALLRRLKEMGYEVGSGIMVGLPGQSLESVAADIELFGELDLDMIGIGPFIPHPGTPLAGGERGSELLVYKGVALARLMCPEANIPATTALATINKVNGRELGLQRGANVVMPNLTPIQYRKFYEIYPAKACIDETGEACNGCLRGRIASIGRRVGVGAGGRERRVEHA